MKVPNRRRRVRRTRTAVIMMTLAGVALVAGPAAGQDLEELLTQVGEEYARAYASPFIFAHGPNQNSNMYSTAEIPWGKLQFGVGVKVMGTHINESDQTFRRVIENVDLGQIDPGLDGQTGTVILEGPTIFGKTNVNGRIQAMTGGVVVYEREGIPGLIDTRFVPLATPEAYVGGIMGFKAVLRWFPEMDLSEYGKTKYLGYGLQWSASELLVDFPVDLMVGFFTQSLDVSNLIDSDASTIFVAASKSWPMLTVYGGFASEKSEMKVAYTFEDPEGDFSDQEIRFTEEGIQKSRFTVGATLDVLMKLNLEMAHGKLTTYSAGLMFGF